MGNYNTCIFLLLFFVAIQSSASLNNQHCQCSKISIKSGNQFHKVFKWHSHGDHGTIYQEDYGSEYLARDASGYWGIGLNIDGSNSRYWTSIQSACPGFDKQNWHPLANMQTVYAFVLKCNGYLGYLPENQNLACVGPRKIFVESFLAAIENCNEDTSCNAVQQWRDSKNLFSSCKDTKKQNLPNGIFFVKGCATMHGLECQFPFIYKGTTYSSCTSEHNPAWSNQRSGFWCATSRYKGIVQGWAECEGWCKRGKQSNEEPSTSSLDSITTKTSQDPMTKGSLKPRIVDLNEQSFIAKYDIYIYIGSALIIVLISIAVILTYFVKRNRRKGQTESPNDDTKYEDDGYDYIGQIDIIQQDEPEVNSDANSEYDSKNTTESGAKSTEHITKFDNPYYEGIS